MLSQRDSDKRTKKSKTSTLITEQNGEKIPVQWLNSSMRAWSKRAWSTEAAKNDQSCPYVLLQIAKETQS